LSFGLIDKGNELRNLIIRTIIFSITTIILMVSCSVPKPEPKPQPKPKREHTPSRKSKTTTTKKSPEYKTNTSKFTYTPEFLTPNPTDQLHIFELKITDVTGKPISGVEFEAEVELLGSIENERLIESKPINVKTNYSGSVHFEITHPITQTKNGYNTYTLVNFAAYKDGFLDMSGSFDLQHSEPSLTKDYQTEKQFYETTTLLKPADFFNNGFNLYSDEVKINFYDVENCIETFAMFPSTYGELKTGSVTIVKFKNEFFLEFGFNSDGNDEWLLETYKSIGRRMGSSLFDSKINGIRLRVNNTTTFSTSTDSLSKYLEREYSDSKFLKKIKKG